VNKFEPHALFGDLRRLQYFASRSISPNVPSNQALEPLAKTAQQIRAQCEQHGLVVSRLQAQRVLEYLEQPAASMVKKQLESLCATLTQYVEDECSTLVFLSIEKDRGRCFERPRDGWEQIINRFPDTTEDIEEMGRCFALDRCAGAVFHSLQAVEIGLIELGTFLKVTDPHPGWNSAERALKRVIGTKYEEREEFERRHFAFLEQLNGTVEGLKTAWRNKVSHAQGKLILMTSDFAPDVAEEVMMATRSLLRRLADGLPGTVKE
jgi:hypothetical protein